MLYQWFNRRQSFLLVHSFLYETGLITFNAVALTLVREELNDLFWLSLFEVMMELGIFK